MSSKRIGWYSVLAVALFCTPLLASAQVQIQIPLPPGWPQFREEPPPAPPEHYGDEPRGLLEVINDWEDQVSITVWTNQRERIGEWVVSPGQINTFEEGGRRVKVRPHYKIKVGEDWGWVDVGQVGQFHNGIDRDTGRSKGFGFVEMPDSTTAKTAIQGLQG